MKHARNVPNLVRVDAEGLVHRSSGSGERRKDQNTGFINSEVIGDKSIIKIFTPRQITQFLFNLVR